MRATIHPPGNIGDWFSGPVARSTLQYLDQTGLLIAPRSKVHEWRLRYFDQPSSTIPIELLEALLERLLSVDTELDASSYFDFQLDEKPRALEDTLDSEAYEATVKWRQASPFLEGEGTPDAFARLFGHLLPLSRDWQIVDQFLLEQLMRKESVWDFLAGNVGAFPSEVEIHSRSPRYDLRTSIEAKQSLQELESVFLANSRKLTIFSYFSLGDNSVKFPHPRLQKIRFPKKDLISSLDNGLNSLVLSGPAVFSQVSTRDWTAVKENLSLMKVRILTKY